MKRLAVRGDPSSTTSLFPRPEHPLLPDQYAANKALIKTLSKEIDKANRLAKKVDIIAKDFRTAYEAVKRVETLTKSAEELSSALASIITKLEEGISTDEGDGTSPNLSDDRCLDPTSHSVFLAFLPSLLESAQRTIDEAHDILKIAPAALIGLEIPGIDRKFKENAAANVNDLALIRGKALSVRDAIVGRVARLRECRKISSCIDSKVTVVKALKSQVVDCMQQERWQQESGNTGTPPTPESSTTSLLASDNVGSNFDDEFLQISSQLKFEITDPLDALSATLEPELLSCLKEKDTRLQKSLQKGNHSLRVLYAIREQTTAMNSVRDQFHEIVSRIEDSMSQVQGAIEITLEAALDDVLPITEPKIIDLRPIEDEVTGFLNSLTHRVPFVAQHTANRKTLANPRPPSFMSTKISNPDDFDDLTIDFVAVDAGVRADSNSYAMRLSGKFDTLKNGQKHLDLAMKARLVDLALKSTDTDIDTIMHELNSQKSFLSTIPRDSVKGIDQLEALSDDLVRLSDRRISIGRSLSPTRAVLREMDELSNTLDSSTRQSIFKTRDNAANDVELRIKSWDEDFAALNDSVSSALSSVQRHQDDLKAAEERQKKAEAERLAAEEQERLRLEKEAKLAAEQRRLLEEKLAEEQRMELERQREASERAERQRLAQEAAEAERLALEELEKQATAARDQELKDKLAREEAERARLEQERIEMLAKIREAEVQLQEERRLHAEREAAALELEKERQLQMEFQQKLQEAQRLAEEQERRAQVEELVRQQKLQLERLAEAQARELKIEKLERIQEVEARRVDEEKTQQMTLEFEKQRQAERQQIEDEKAREIDLVWAEAKRLAEEQARRSKSEEFARQQQIEENRLAEERAAQAKLRELAESEALRIAEEQAYQTKLEHLTRQREIEKQKLIDELAKSESGRALAEQALQAQLEQAARQLQAKEDTKEEKQAGEIDAKELGEHLRAEESSKQQVNEAGRPITEFALFKLKYFVIRRVWKSGHAKLIRLSSFKRIGGASITTCCTA